MLRALAHGYRDFREMPDTLCVRFNWIILCLFEGSLHPRFDPPLPCRQAAAGMNFWVIPPNTRYVIVADTRRCDRAVFHFSVVPQILQNAIEGKGCLARRLDTNRLGEVRSIATSIDEDFHRPTALSEVRYEIVLLRLVLIALEELDAQPVHSLHNLSRERVEKALSWYDEHMAESPSLQQVAGHLHVSQTHLRRHFYERLGRSPKAIFTKLRMQRAAKLLVGTMLTLDQIAEQCGFTTASDLCRAFRQHFHVTPNCWRHNVNSAPPVRKPKSPQL